MRKLPILLLTLSLILGGASFAVATQTAASNVPPSFTITGVDLHDGMMLNVGSTYYLYGTSYACGFTFLVPSSSYCGEWVRSCTTACTSDSNGSNWTDATDLVVPSAIDPLTGQTWQYMCVSGNKGYGCFNPRMVDDEGSFTLWWSGPGQNGANGYEAFSCSGPMGPCTTPAPGTNEGKPILHGACAAATGDFDISNGNQGAPSDTVMMCTVGASAWLPYQFIDEEGLNNAYGTGDNGEEYTVTNVTHVNELTGPGVEAPGAFITTNGDAALTYSWPNCAYCASDNTLQDETVDYAHPFKLEGGEIDTPGQPRTMVHLTDQTTGVAFNYQEYDLWTGSLTNEISAGLMYVPNLSS